MIKGDTVPITKNWRVKLYELYEREWTDNGTGYIKVEKTPIPKIIITREDNKDDMLTLVINDDIDFHIQRNTILTWKRDIEEDNDSDDIGMSFQDRDGIKEIMNFIYYYTGKEINLSETDSIAEAFSDVSRSNLPFIAHFITNELQSHEVMELLFYIKANDYEFIKKLGNCLLEEEKELEGIKSSITRSTQSSFYSKQNDAYNKMVNDFKLPQMENLLIIYTIFKNMFLLEDKELLENLLNNELYMITFGALEYDYELQNLKGPSIRHREYFKTGVKFRNFLSITDNNILNTIHQNHRLNYLKDVAIMEFINDDLKRNITSMIQSNNYDIVQFFIKNKNFIIELINKLKLNKNNYSKWELCIVKDSCKFLLEMINCSKDYINRHYVNELLCSNGLFMNFEKLLSIETLPSYVSQLIIEIVLEIISYSTRIIKDFLSDKSSSPMLLSLITRYSTIEGKTEFTWSLSEIIKNAFMVKDNNDIIDILLEKCIIPMIDSLYSPKMGNESKAMIFTILIQCVSSLDHISKMHKWIIDNDIAERVFQLRHIEGNQGKVIVLHLIKFIKALIEYNYNIDLTQEEFDWITTIFMNNKSKNNATLSSISELFNIMHLKYPSKINHLFSLGKKFLYSNKDYWAKLIDKYELFNQQEKKNIEENKFTLEIDIIDNTINKIDDDVDMFDKNCNLLDKDIFYNQLLYFDDNDTDGDVFKLIGHKIECSTSFDNLFNNCDF